MLLKKILPLFLILNSNISLAQPELRFNPFDWVLYKHTGSINSISFGDRYAFIGTQNGGVVRFNTRSQRFEEPITRSQGLKSDFVTAVHYASSGILWVATINALNYSFDAEGDWRSVSLESLGLSIRNPIIRIGDDGKDIWVEASGQLMRIDEVTGIKLESMIRQNKKIFWSSGPNIFWQEPAEFLFEYTFLDGWMQNLNEMIDPNGQTISITTIAENNFGEIMIGCEDGSLFFGDRTMKLLSSFKFGINNRKERRLKLIQKPINYTFHKIPNAIFENNYNFVFRCNFRPFSSKPILPNISSDKAVSYTHLTLPTKRIV